MEQKDESEITSTTGAGHFYVKKLFVFKACPVFITGAQKQAHSELCNCFCNAEDGQKGKPVVQVISCTFLGQLLANAVKNKTVLTIALCFILSALLPAHANTLNYEIIFNVEKPRWFDGIKLPRLRRIFVSDRTISRGT